MRIRKNRRTHRAMSIIVLVLIAGLSVTVAYACQFWAISTPNTSNVNGFEPDYTASANMLATLACNNSQDGWGLVEYWSDGTDIATQFRSDDPIFTATCGPSTEYAAAYGDALSREAHAVIAHARDGSPLVDDPHPFVYELYGQTWALQHNGTIYHPDDMEDDFGAGFCALDIFNVRTYTWWHDWNPEPVPVPPLPDNRKRRIDSEYYAMQLMKDYLIGSNYYTTAPVAMTPMEWAVNRTIYKIPTVSTYSSLNAALTNGWDLWGMDKETDGNHFVSYWPISDANDGERMISTTIRADQVRNIAWHSITNGKYVRMNPWEPVVHDGTDSFQKLFQNMATHQTPRELRVNGSSNSAGDQKNPAISADPVHGTFVAVWEDANSGRIKARPYNQMGLAEQDEFFVDMGATGYTRSAPAIAHHPSGDRITVIWLEKPNGGPYFNRVKALSYGWNQTDRVWRQIGTSETTVNVTIPASYNLMTPAISYSTRDLTTDGIWAATWSGGGYLYSRISSWASNQEKVYTPASGYEYVNPDICFYGCWDKYCSDERFQIIFVRRQSFVSPSQHSIVRATIKISDPTLTSVGTPYAVGSMDPFNYPAPSICNNGAYGYRELYYSVTNSRLQYSGENRALGIPAQLSITGVTSSTGAYGRTDIARRNDGYDLCFAKTNGANNKDIYVGRMATTSETPVVVNTVTGATDQVNPSIAVASTFECRDGADPDFYNTASTNHWFTQRRVILWQSNGQPGGNGIDVTGRFTGLNGASANDKDWYASDPTTFGLDPDRHPTLLSQRNSGNSDGQDTRGGSGNLDEGTPSNLPTTYGLHQAYPNPFNPITNIRFDLPEAASVQLRIFNSMGQLVTTLVNDSRAAGSYTVVWDGKDASGQAVSAGLYIYQLNSGTFHSSQKMLLLK